MIERQLRFEMVYGDGRRMPEMEGLLWMKEFEETEQIEHQMKATRKFKYWLKQSFFQEIE